MSIDVAKGLLDYIHRAQVARLQREYAQVGVNGGPYPWQVSFHEAGKDNTERAIIAANRVGKTRTAAAEFAMHATGLYPEWWNGHRFTRPTTQIVAGQTNEDVRDIQQLALFGAHGAKGPNGTGWVPGELFRVIGYRQCGVTNVLDSVAVKHTTGGDSLIQLKSYEQGWEKFQGRAADVIWLDEEIDDFQLFTECQTRLMTTMGILIFTATPLKGMSKIVEHFMEGMRVGKKGIWFIGAGWRDAPHISEKQRTEWTDRYPVHERDARTEGIPLLGTGLVYPIGDGSMILCDPFPLPDHWARIAGCDFGIEHAGAGAWIAHDRDTDTTYLYDCYKEPGQLPAYHAQAIRARGPWIPVAWPHDGIARDKGSGKPLAGQYEKRGVNMLPEPAAWEEEVRDRRKGVGGIARVGPQSREAGSAEILERMRTGRFKVFRTAATELFMREIRTLHRKDGVIVPANDHVESCVRYGHMMLRYALSVVEGDSDATVGIEIVEYDPFKEFSR